MNSNCELNKMDGLCQFKLNNRFGPNKKADLA